ncbi:hybrid sensor histidine kinase/response regulator [Paraglaciecola aquimarina]|uniref:histidine kinase n=1 Tax=Paraglaciecola algarum TaxID=3050085 RepID=A0ABS9D6H8_9ALTE|nr:hybrid sensor histidine kinase/response regulator [Paraglaciecola sp. G1-23]MCF2948030.1 hybrid sensor histidine kinase/response regulator [Paraglaciecola sp. G1-23]
MEITKKTKAKADLLSSQRKTLWIANLTTALVTAFIYGLEGQALLATIWCIAHYTLAAIRYVDIRAYQRGDYDSEEKLQVWFKKFVFYTSLAGGLWSICAYFIYVINQPSVLIYSVIIMLSMATGALLALTAHFPAYLGFILPIFFGLCLSLYFSDFSYSNIIALLVFLYGCCIISFGKNLSQQSLKSITNELQVQDLLAQTSAAKEGIERATHEKNRLLALISHDLSQPIFTISLLTQSLQNTPDLISMKELAKRLQTSVEGLQSLFSAFMEFAAIEDGRTPTNFSHFQIHNILNNIENDFRPLAEAKGLEFVVDDCQETVRSDSLLLGRVLRNIVGNAIKYTPSGKVRIKVEHNEASLIIHVLDSGVGIAKRHLNEIFCEYTQLDNTNNDLDKGLGLGLTVVKQLCLILDHPYSLLSTPGKGTDFSVEIPLINEIGCSTNITEDKPDFKDIHVLVIEDDESVRAALCILLQQWGCQTSSGENLNIALSVSAEIKRPLDIVLCDYDLGEGMNGLQCIEQLRLTIDPQLPTILISGRHSEKTKLQAQRSGITFLTKPLAHMALREQFNKLL